MSSLSSIELLRELTQATLVHVRCGRGRTQQIFPLSESLAETLKELPADTHHSETINAS